MKSLTDLSTPSFAYITFTSSSCILIFVISIYTVKVVMFFIEVVSHSYVMFVFIPRNIPCLKSTLSDINILFPAFFWLVFTQYIFFYPFTFLKKVFKFWNYFRFPEKLQK